jgi:hypothetical protein
MMSEQTPMARYTFHIVADSGYESTTEGECTLSQYRMAMAALHGALAEPERRGPLSDGWQPIETAPRYGRILVTGTEIGTCVASAAWDTETPETVRWGVVNDVYVTPTHWMTLPPRREPLTDEQIYAVVRSKQPYLEDTSVAWKQQFAECKYWLLAAHYITGEKT